MSVHCMATWLRIKLSLNLPLRRQFSHSEKRWNPRWRWVYSSPETRRDARRLCRNEQRSCDSTRMSCDPDMRRLPERGLWKENRFLSTAIILSSAVHAASWENPNDRWFSLRDTKLLPVAIELLTPCMKSCLSLDRLISSVDVVDLIASGFSFVSPFPSLSLSARLCISGSHSLPCGGLAVPIVPRCQHSLTQMLLRESCGRPAWWEVHTVLNTLWMKSVFMGGAVATVSLMGFWCWLWIGINEGKDKKRERGWNERIRQSNQGKSCCTCTLLTRTHVPSRNVLLSELNPDGPRLGFLWKWNSQSCRKTRLNLWSPAFCYAVTFHSIKSVRICLRFGEIGLFKYLSGVLTLVYDSC